MPAGTSEQRHHHDAVRQVFFVLEGVLTLEVDGEPVRLDPQDALEIAPGQIHQARNDSKMDVAFLVISNPPVGQDRRHS